MLFAGEVWPFCFDWFTIIFRVGILLWLIHSNLQGRDFALICGLFGSAGSAECEWGRMENMCVFMACFVNLGCFEHNECDEERWSKLCYVIRKIWQASDLSRRWRIYVVRKMCIMKEKESVFRFLSKGKHFPLLKLCFLCWPELNFRWLVFHVVAKHGKTRKVNSRNHFPAIKHALRN